MRYMMLVYSAEKAAELSAEQDAAIRVAHAQVMREAAQKGILENAEPLYPTTTARTVRKENGDTVVTDGPFAETKEQLAGYYILNCADLDEALEWAAKIPTGCKGADGCIEVRPLPGIHAVNA